MSHAGNNREIAATRAARTFLRMEATSISRRLVVIGHGMVGHRLLELLRAQPTDWSITVFGAEPTPAYDRVHLSSTFEGKTADDLSLVEPGFFDDDTVLVLDDPIVEIDRAEQVVRSASGRVERYDALVLATGSRAVVPPLPGADGRACHVYRTLADLDAIRASAAAATRGLVVGGGLLGLEAAKALHALGLQTTVVELSPWLMPTQLDPAGGDLLAHRIAELGIEVITDRGIRRLELDDHDRVTSFVLDEASYPVDLVVFATGIRADDALAREAGLAVETRGGIVVDDRCRTSDDRIWAIGECASVGGSTHGLVAPGYAMARIVADTLTGGTPESFGADDGSTRLKLLGVDVANFGKSVPNVPSAETISFTDGPNRIHKRLLLDDAGNVVGGVLVGDTDDYATFERMARGEIPTPDDPASLIAPSGGGAPVIGIESLPDDAIVCSCENVTKGAICAAVADGAMTPGDVKGCTGAGSGCGGCVPLVTDLVRAELTARGVTVDRSLCEHFALSRQDLFDLIRVEGLTSFVEVIERHGTGVPRGCEVCKPTIASILASLGNGYILGDGQAALQDANDRFLANLQKNGSYSVVPRIPGGEITPERLIVIGEVARDFGLYTKITGGQRIDLFGAKVDELPAIWKRLIDAGFESGHAYGKALRTVKSCVGTAWCRFGVGDSTTLAIDLELRYRGLRAPHKIKMAVSGCARECAEAQSKDVGVIATERGWNLYVCGNGGQRPRHATLLAEDLSRERLIQIIDRFLMYYIRTADKLQRTAPWLEQIDGGIEHLKAVLLEDSLGIGADLEAAMADHVAGYSDEWADTLAQPERVAQFSSFVNSLDTDPDITFTPERDQHRVAFVAPPTVRHRRRPRRGTHR